MLLRRLSFENFKALESVALDLAPITVLIGPNNAGKSSVLQGLALLAQSASGGIRDPLSPSGPLVDLGASLEELVTKSSRGTDGFEMNLDWVPSRAESGRYDSENTASVSLRVRQPPPPRHVHTALASSFEYPGKGKTRLTVEYPQLQQQVRVEVGDKFEYQVTVSNMNSPWQWNLFPTSSWPAEATEAGLPDVEASLLALFSPFLQQGLRDQLAIFNYVDPDRHVTSSAYPALDGPTDNPRDAAQVVNTLAYQREVRQRVSNRCRQVFDYGIDTQAIPPKKFALVAVDENGEGRNAVNMGTGLTQLAWIALHLELTIERARQQAVYSGLSPTPIVGVEEPELHLHPRLQGEVARLLLDFLPQGQILCTTQSEHFLIALLQFVLEGSLAPEDLAVYFLDQGRAERLEVDKKGRLAGGLRGFFEANEEELLTRLDALVGSKGKR